MFILYCIVSKILKNSAKNISHDAATLSFNFLKKYPENHGNILEFGFEKPVDTLLRERNIRKYINHI